MLHDDEEERNKKVNPEENKKEMLPAGELFGISYDFERAPHAYYTVIDASGGVMLDMPIALPQPLIMHHSAVTEE